MCPDWSVTAQMNSNVNYVAMKCLLVPYRASRFLRQTNVAGHI